VRPTLGGAGADSPLVVAPGARVVGEIPSVLRGGSPYGTSFGAGAMLGYRFHPLVSAGLRGDFGSLESRATGSGRDSRAPPWRLSGMRGISSWRRTKERAQSPRAKCAGMAPACQLTR
jgi:hypothetical protein